MIARLIPLAFSLLVSIQLSAQCTDPTNIPENDDPCPTAVNPPIDLSDIGSHEGTTCCSRGANDDPTFDFANAECSSATDDDAVWYTYNPEGFGDGFYINVDPAGGLNGISGNVTVEVYYTTDPNGGCTGNLTLENASCVSIGVGIELAIPLCDLSFLYYIKIASAEDDCGEFTISINELASNCAADECIDAEILITETPEDCESGENIISIEGCIEFACPEDEYIACMSDAGPTVWYQINIDSPEATVLLTEVTASGFDVTWSIWQSTTGSCEDMINVADPEPAPEPWIPCGTPGLDDIYLTIPIVQDPPGTPATYWIAITALDEIEDPIFSINYASTITCISCSGANKSDCDNGNWVASVDGEEIGIDDYQNFCSGQEVEICVDFIYDSSPGNDGLNGIIPNFGNGWDIDAIDFDTVDIGGAWEWVDSDGPCSTTTSFYKIPNLCTYEEGDVLKLCNTACNQDCPCESPLEPMSTLPSGWFWNESSSIDCVVNSCLPIERRGITSSNYVSVEICFGLKTKSNFNSTEDCESNNDLSISIQTLSSAVSGCRVAEPCLYDPSITSPNWQINCNGSTAVVGQGTEICSGDELDIQVSTQDGSTTTIIVEAIPNANIVGETDFEFFNGVGIINNTLTNTSNTTQSVVYNIYSSDPTLNCPSAINQIEVTIFPDVEIEFNDPLVTCGEESIDVIALPSGGTGSNYSYQWGAPGFESTSSIVVGPIVNTFYYITVTDDLGCTNANEVGVIASPEITSTINATQTFACINSVEENLISLEVDIQGGIAPFTINWGVDSFNSLDFVLSDNEFNNGRLTVYEETSDQGDYLITAEVHDAVGCIDELQIEIFINYSQSEDSIYTCEGNEIELELPSLGEGTIFFWNTGEFSQSIMVTAIDTFKYIGIAENGICSFYYFNTVFATSSTNEEVRDTQSLCIGSDLILTAESINNQSEYVWSTGEQIPAITVTPTDTTTYCVTIVDTDCNRVECTTINVQDQISVELVADTICLGASTDIEAVVSYPDATLVWSTGAIDSIISVSPTQIRIRSW